MVIFGCGRVKPQPPALTVMDSSLVVPMSSLVVPIRYHIDSLQHTLNSKVKGVFLKQWIVVNEKKDSLYLELSKQAPIVLRWKNTVLHYRVPLHIAGKFIKHLGSTITLQNETPVTMDVILHLSTQLSFDKEWNLQPRTTLQQIEWKKEPVLKIAFLQINLRKRLESLLKEKEDMLVGRVDDAVLKLLDTRGVVEKLWTDIQKTIVLNKEEKKVWLQHSAEALQASLLQDGDYLGIDVHLQTKIQTRLEGQEMPAPNVVLPAYSPINTESSGISLYVLSSIPFSVINETLTEKLKGKKLTSKGYSSTIKKIRAYGTKEGLALQVDLKGDADGTVYARGTPEYDSLHSTLKIQDFNFDIASENALVQSADWLLHEDVLTAVEEKLSIDLQPLLDKLPQTIIDALEKGKTGKKMELFITSLDVSLHALLITQTDVQLILKAKGGAVIGLQKEVFAKKTRTITP